MQVGLVPLPCSAGEIIAALQQNDPAWHPRTAKTFLNRLVKKKVLGFWKGGPRPTFIARWPAGGLH